MSSNTSFLKTIKSIITFYNYINILIRNEDKMRVKDAAKIFSSSYLSRLATGDFSLVNRVASELLSINPLQYSIVDIYERTYKELSKHYRHEYYYKNTIANKRLLGRHNLNTATMLSEFRVGNNIADCVILNGHSTCYEIKTEFDSLSRLTDQLNSYLRLFDKVNVVSDEKFIEAIANIIPKEVGIICLKKNNTLSTIRESEVITTPICPTLVMNSLRATEYKELVKILSGEVPNVGNIKMYSACQEIILQATPSILRDEYRKILKVSRKNNKKLIENLPKSLINAGISYKLPVKLQNNLISTFLK